jgi:hypothetical protein
MYFQKNITSGILENFYFFRQKKGKGLHCHFSRFFENFNFGWKWLFFVISDALIPNFLFPRLKITEKVLKSAPEVAHYGFFS